MKFPAFRPALALLAAGLLLAACSKDDEDNSTPATTGSVTWTNNGTTYTSTVNSSAIMDSDTSLLITGSSVDLKNTVSLRLKRITQLGATTYPLRKGSVLNYYSVGVLTVVGVNGTGSIFNTLYGSAATNGTATVTQFDRTAQKASGTFSFTAGALPNSSASGTQSVTNGSFSFSKFY